MMGRNNSSLNTAEEKIADLEDVSEIKRRQKMAQTNEEHQVLWNIKWPNIQAIRAPGSGEVRRSTANI